MQEQTFIAKPALRFYEDVLPIPSFRLGIRNMVVQCENDEILHEVNAGLRIIQKKKSLLFGTDALLLAAFIRKQKGLAYEFGGGSGIISLLCAQRGKFSKIRVFEVQPELSAVIQKNIALNSAGGIISSHQLDVRDIRKEFPDEYADVVFTNPPYMTCGCGKKNENEMKYISRHEVFGGIDDFCSSAAASLKFGGLFYCVWRGDRLADLFFSLRKNELEPKRMTLVHDRVGTPPSMLLIEAKKGAAPSLFITEPLLLKDKEGPTESAKYIYDNGEFDERFRKK